MLLLRDMFQYGPVNYFVIVTVAKAGDKYGRKDFS